MAPATTAKPNLVKNVTDCYDALGYRSRGKLSGKFKETIRSHWRDFETREGYSTGQGGKLKWDKEGEEKFNRVIQDFIEKHSETYWPAGQESPCGWEVVWPRDQDKIFDELTNVFWYLSRRAKRQISEITGLPTDPEVEPDNLNALGRNEENDDEYQPTRSVQQSLIERQDGATTGDIAEGAGPSRTPRQQRKTTYAGPYSDDGESSDISVSEPSPTVRGKRPWVPTEEELEGEIRSPKKPRQPYAGTYGPKFPSNSARGRRKGPGCMSNRHSRRFGREPEPEPEPTPLPGPASTEEVNEDETHDRSRRSPSVIFVPPPGDIRELLDRDQPRSATFVDREVAGPARGFRAPTAHMTPTVDRASPIIRTVESPIVEEFPPLDDLFPNPPQGRAKSRQVRPAEDSPIPEKKDTNPGAPRIVMRHYVEFFDKSMQHREPWFPARAFDDMSLKELEATIPIKTTKTSTGLLFTFADNRFFTDNDRIPWGSVQAFDNMKTMFRERKEDSVRKTTGCAEAWFFVYIKEYQEDADDREIVSASPYLC